MLSLIVGEAKNVEGSEFDDWLVKHHADQTEGH
jgi:hypothetical protein